MRIVRANALQEFKLDPSIDVLLMDGVATVGHDLSCVSDIICMEAIPQREAWDQLISRAYRMGADVRRPITVTTLAYRGSAEDRLVPEYASHTVTSTGVSSIPVSSCNTDRATGHQLVADWNEGWEDDWDMDSAARQAAAVAVDDEPARWTPPASKRQKRPKRSSPRTPQQQVGVVAAPARVATTAAAPTGATAGVTAGATAAAAAAATAAAAAAAPPPPPPPPLLPGRSTCLCVLHTQTFLGARTGHEFKLGPQGLGYYPTPQRLRMLEYSTQRWTVKHPDGRK